MAVAPFDPRTSTLAKAILQAQERKALSSNELLIKAASGTDSTIFSKPTGESKTQPRAIGSRPIIWLAEIAQMSNTDTGTAKNPLAKALWAAMKGPLSETQFLSTLLNALSLCGKCLLISSCWGCIISRRKNHRNIGPMCPNFAIFLGPHMVNNHWLNHPQWWLNGI